MRPPTIQPQAFLPLKPEVLYILLALSEGPQHGYGVMQWVRERSEGKRRLHTGPFYRHLRRLLDDGLVEERSRPPKGRKDDARRGPYYQLTRLGTSVVAAECRRMDQLVQLGRTLGVAGGRRTR